jgi:hypothetical protein
MYCSSTLIIWKRWMKINNSFRLVPQIIHQLTITNYSDVALQHALIISHPGD